jgi:hypothetical protein
MSGGFGPSGIGWMSWGKSYIVIPLDMISEDFDISAAVVTMRGEKAQSEIEDLVREKQGSTSEPRRRLTRVRPCAVYRFYDGRGRLLYVGKALNPVSRQRQHEKRAWWPDVDQTYTRVEWWSSEREALDAEDIAIRDENPIYNRAGGGRK